MIFMSNRFTQPKAAILRSRQFAASGKREGTGSAWERKNSLQSKEADAQLPRKAHCMASSNS
jgi:hypothetical protein